MAAIENRCEDKRVRAMPQRSERPLQKLIIPSFTYQIKHIGDYDAENMLRADIPEEAAATPTGVLLAGLLPFKALWKRVNLNASVEKAGNITIVRQYGKAPAPLRLIRPEKRVEVVGRLGMKAYDAYFETAGRPDIVYAYDLLYAGVIAKMLHAAYDLPYIVIGRRTPNMRGPYAKALMNIAREVLADASSVHVIGSEPYRQLKEAFGDLAVIKNALVV